MIHGLLSLYSWRYPARLIALWHRQPALAAYLQNYWTTPNFSNIPLVPKAELSKKERFTLTFLYVWIALQLTSAIWLAVAWRFNDLTGGWQFALATAMSYPLLLPYVLLLARGIWALAHPKVLGRAVVCGILESQVKRLRRKNLFQIVAVAGSVGKTSTKIAIARTLQASRRVQWQEGNYNDRATIPLIFFGHDQPALFDVLAWIKIFLKNERIIAKPYPFDIVVVELGTDHPGSIREFAYIQPDVVVITAVTLEHMEYFKTLDAVAKEELTALDFTKQAVINTDDTPPQYLKERTFTSYGLHSAEYSISKRWHKGLEGQDITFQLGSDGSFTLPIPLLGEHGAKIALAAAATAHVLKLSSEDIKKGIANVSAFAGRMQVLQGKRGSTLIDDTYNATPIAAKAALDVLYSGEAPQRIAILGSMNELGDYSPEAHREVGAYCDPAKLDLVITIGKDAEEYLAPVARDRGCKVKTFLGPHKAGDYVRQHVKEGAVILAKGSQNGVFAEEALKPLLANKEDASKLVRQSKYWMGVKAKQFKD